ncbi:hypothetical protein GCM10027432_20440 [Lysobacter fragariae]
MRMGHLASDREVSPGESRAPAGALHGLSSMELQSHDAPMTAVWRVHPTDGVGWFMGRIHAGREAVRTGSS